jgi:hypothetical protein
MKILSKRVVFNNLEEYYFFHLSLSNSFLEDKLTEKEMSILSSFMAVKKELVEDDRFNSLVRRKVMEKHKISAGGLSNHLRSMIDKGILTKSKVTGRIKIESFIIPDRPSQGYQIRIDLVRPTKKVKAKSEPKVKVKDKPKKVAPEPIEVGEGPTPEIKSKKKEVKSGEVKTVLDVYGKPVDFGDDDIDDEPPVKID